MGLNADSVDGEGENVKRNGLKAESLPPQQPTQAMEGLPFRPVHISARSLIPISASVTSKEQNNPRTISE